jgi:uncharacterized membrane protein YvbJ
MRCISVLKKRYLLYLVVLAFLFYLLCLPRTTVSVFYLTPDEIVKYIEKYERKNDKASLQKLVNYYMLSEQNSSATIAFLRKYHRDNNDYRFYLSDMLLDSRNSADVKEALQILRELSFMSFPPAQSRLANFYAQGMYIEKNATLALHWAKNFDCLQISQNSEPYEIISIYKKTRAR